MSTIAGISIKAILIFVFLILSQIVATSILPKTNGFRNLGWTLGCLGTYAVSFFAMAEIIRRGMPMSLLVPIMAALIPLATIAVAVTVYGESASLPKLGLLSIACIAIGVASTLK